MQRLSYYAAIHQAQDIWRNFSVTPPTNPLTEAKRKLSLLMRSIGRLVQDRANLQRNLKTLRHAYSSGGMHHLKGALLSLPPKTKADSWEFYQHRLHVNVLPSIQAQIAKQGAPVTISIVVPAYNTDPVMLKEMLQSVQDQLYPNWELCIADDCSTKPHVRSILESYAAKDPRIKLHFASENRGVAHTSNQAIAMATGPFVVLLDHDDLLEPQAVYRVAEAVIHNDADMIYSDEMMISADRKKMLYHAHRPAFSPEYLRGHPYIVHMVGFRTQLLRDIGGFDESLRISQDYDLILRASEQAKKIVHLPEILYLWRVHENSAGHEQAAKVMDTSSARVQRHHRRCNSAGTLVPGAGFNFFASRYPIQAGVRVAIIIPTKNHGDLVRQCVESIHDTVKEVAFDIIVIDHESTDPATTAYLGSISDQARVMRYEGPFNFSTINNWAIAQLPDQYSHYLLCNNDIEAIKPGWLEQMVGLAQDPSVGMVGAELLYPDRKSIQHAGVCVGAFGIAEHYGKFLEVDPDTPDIRYLGRLAIPHELSAVTAACALIRKDAFDAVNGMDELLRVGFGDVDLCLRVL